MKKYEKLAEKHSKIWRCPIDKEDIKEAYEEGFLKAREMAVMEFEGDYSIELLKELGEEEVE